MLTGCHPVCAVRCPHGVANNSDYICVSKSAWICFSSSFSPFIYLMVHLQSKDTRALNKTHKCELMWLSSLRTTEMSVPFSLSSRRYLSFTTFSCVCACVYRCEGLAGYWPPGAWLTCLAAGSTATSPEASLNSFVSFPHFQSSLTSCFISLMIKDTRKWKKKKVFN